MFQQVKIWFVLQLHGLQIEKLIKGLQTKNHYIYVIFQKLVEKFKKIYFITFYATTNFLLRNNVLVYNLIRDVIIWITI